MKIELHEIPIREIVKNYIDSAEEGVVGYDGRLNIRPIYQREYVYTGQQRQAVLETILKGFPLNVMYWAKNDDGNFELMDGQQRTISFCQYVNNEFSINYRGFDNLTLSEKVQILDYKCMVYFCEGNEKEKLDWFRIINIAGVKLTDQELRNVVYTGPWLSHAKSIFSKSNCAAYLLSKEYVPGSPIRQEVFETALKWISKGSIESNMSTHQHNQNANELWIYFQNVIHWVQLTFPKYRSEMKGINWAALYDTHHGKIFDTAKLEAKVQALMMDDDVTNKKGIYPYVLDHQERSLNIRAFTESNRREAFERQAGVCPKCCKTFNIEGMEADHITPWHLGGKTIASNCQMLCKECNRRKSGV